MDELATEVSGQAKVVSINVDQNGALGARYGVRGIPSLLVFKRGQIVDELRPGSGMRDRLLAHAN